MQNTFGLNPNGFVSNVIIIIQYCILLVPQALVFGMLFHTIYQLAQGKSISYVESISFTLRRWFPMLLSALYYNVLVLVGLAFFIIPGVYFSVAYIFYLMFVVIENKGPWQALRSSTHLVKGNWWTVMAVHFVPFVILMAVIIILQGGFSYFVYFNPVLFWFFSFVVTVLFIMFFGCLNVMMYRLLSIKHEEELAKQALASEAS